MLVWLAMRDLNGNMEMLARERDNDSMVEKNWLRGTLKDFRHT